jgi:hypothetical protein
MPHTSSPLMDLVSRAAAFLVLIILGNLPRWVFSFDDEVAQRRRYETHSCDGETFFEFFQ